MTYCIPILGTQGSYLSLHLHFGCHFPYHFPSPRLSFYLSLILSSSSSPDSSLDELEKLLVLLLGCVVQCEGRGPLIERMTTMGIMQQQALVVYIKEMTDTTNYVCSIDWNDLGEISRK